MATVIKSTIDRFTDGDFIDEVSVTAQVELIERKGTNGQTKKARALNPTNEFSIKGGGSSGLTLGLSAISLGLAGGVKYVTKDTNTQKNSDFDDFDASGKHLPNATDATV